MMIEPIGPKPGAYSPVTSLTCGMADCMRELSPATSLPRTSPSAQIIWVDRFALSRGHYHWQHEPCYYAVPDAGHWNGDRKQSTVWNMPAREDKGFGHGTQKPAECMRRPIENNSSPGQVVYEPFPNAGGLEAQPRHVENSVRNDAVFESFLRHQFFARPGMHSSVKKRTHVDCVNRLDATAGPTVGGVVTARLQALLKQLLGAIRSTSSGPPGEHNNLVSCLSASRFFQIFGDYPVLCDYETR